MNIKCLGLLCKTDCTVCGFYVTESDIAPWNELSAPVLQQCEWMLPGNKPRIYKPLLQRQTCGEL